MTEQDWLGPADLKAMLSFLDCGWETRTGATVNVRRPSDRKLRLFAVACCRRVWEQLTHDASRAALVAAERFADGHVTEAAMNQAHEARPFSIRGHGDPDEAAGWCCGRMPEHLFFVTMQSGRRQTLVAQAQADLLRDVVGNPFRPLTLDPSWLTPTVQTLATSAYEHRDLPAGTLQLERLAILADVRGQRLHRGERVAASARTGEVLLSSLPKGKSTD